MKIKGQDIVIRSFSDGSSFEPHMGKNQHNWGKMKYWLNYNFDKKNNGTENDMNHIWIDRE